jgi:hypothetical protein
LGITLLLRRAALWPCPEVKLNSDNIERSSIRDFYSPPIKNGELLKRPSLLRLPIRVYFRRREGSSREGEMRGDSSCGAPASLLQFY